MPVGRLTAEEYEKEMGLQNKESHTPQVEVVDAPKRGREVGQGNTPDVLRKIIGETGVIDGRQQALSLAAEFGVSPSSASAYAKGATSTTTYNTPSQSILSHINKSRLRAVKRASGTLNMALGSITQDKLDYADAKDLSGIAKDMSVIIRNLEPQKQDEADSDGGRTPKFVIFAPQFREERSFGETIQVKE